MKCIFCKSIAIKHESLLNTYQILNELNDSLSCRVILKSATFKCVYEYTAPIYGDQNVKAGSCYFYRYLHVFSVQSYVWTKTTSTPIDY